MTYKIIFRTDEDTRAALNGRTPDQVERVRILAKFWAKEVPWLSPGMVMLSWDKNYWRWVARQGFNSSLVLLSTHDEVSFSNVSPGDLQIMLDLLGQEAYNIVQNLDD